MSGFKDVVGHSEIIQYIQNAVTEDKVSHAYILNGEKGSGKKMLAGLFAQTLQCEKGGAEPCYECHSCKQAVSGNHPDIIWVTHEKPNSISVDDIRVQINGDIQVKPYNGKYKIYIVPDADMMTVQAQNALLKNIDTMELGDLVEAVKRISAYKIEITDYLDILMIWYRDVLIYKATMNIDRLIFGEEIDSIRERAKKSSYEGIETILEALEKAKARLRANVNFDLVMELLLLTIKEN